MASPNQARRVEFAAGALCISGLLFVLYPALRPFSDEASFQGAAAFGSSNWILAHTFAMIGFVLLGLGFLGLHMALQETPAERLAFRALVVSWIGIGLTLPYYGAEAFALNVIGRETLKRHDLSVFALANEIRTGPGEILFGIGLLLLAVGPIMFGVAVWRSGTLPRWSGVPLAVAFALFIPQFLAAQPIRIAHGLLIAVGCVWLGVSMWSHERETARRTGSPPVPA